jgi:hypothetical protein
VLGTRRVSARQGWEGEKAGRFEHPDNCTALALARITHERSSPQLLSPRHEGIVRQVPSLRQLVMGLPWQPLGIGEFKGDNIDAASCIPSC